MKILVLLLTFLSFPCLEEWVLISKNSEGVTTYVDNNSISAEGKYLYYWELLDYKNINELGYMSTKTYKQIECNSTFFQTLYLVSFKKPMGEGKIYNNFNPNTKLVTASWGSSNYHSMRAACNYFKIIK